MTQFLDTQKHALAKARDWVRTLREQDEPVGLYIVKTPGTLGGRARIANTRIAVWHVASQHLNGYTSEEIAGLYPHLTEEQIRAALQYFVAHEREVLQEIREESELQ